MKSDIYNVNDYNWIQELLDYPESLKSDLDFFETTADITIPEDPIERVIFQDTAKNAIRKIAQNRGHILMVGRPGTGKSLLASMFNEILDKSLGDYLRPKHAIAAYPGKDKHNIRIAYEVPVMLEKCISQLFDHIRTSIENMGEFNLAEPIRSIRRVKRWLIAAAALSVAAGVFFPEAFIATGLASMGAIFMFIQENQHKAQEKIQRENIGGHHQYIKQVEDMIPEVLFDPRKETQLMARVTESDARNMKGGFRHDPYQSGKLHTPAHKRAFLGAHATSPIIYVDELKNMLKAGYMPELLEVMQSKLYKLEGGRNSGSGAADRSENDLRAENIIVACCNHDTLTSLKQDGDGAFLSRIEDKGEVIEMESAVPESPETIRQVAQYIKQEINLLAKEFDALWNDVLEKEGNEGVRKRCEQIMGRALPENYSLVPREFTQTSVMEIIKELRCRASDRKLSCILRPINGLIKSAEFIAISKNATLVEPEHVHIALAEHLSIEGAMAKELVAQKKDLKKFISTLTDAIGYVVGLAVYNSQSSGQMYGQPLPIHGQVLAGTSDKVTAPGKIGDIAMAAAQNVRASIKKVFKKIKAPYVGYEMHIEYIQAHGGVEGDSASVAMDIALISDYIKQPVNQTMAVTGSLTGDIILPVGGVTEKIRNIMDPDLGMTGVCIPWQNKHDVQPLLINVESEYIQNADVPGIRIYRNPQQDDPFDVYFCKTKFCVYQMLMGLDRETIEERMIQRSQKDLSQRN
ncbi:MAG: hypothetical protein GY874_12545 [Desulfobacteraceae bacterium]|nr:hypothetical protein [Desulfobacteraceae bacterium]